MACTQDLLTRTSSTSWNVVPHVSRSASWPAVPRSAHEPQRRVLVRVGVPCETPPAVGRLRQEHPGTVGERGVPRRIRNEGGESAHHGELLVTIEATGARE